jgi:cell division septal protein FtsQ
VRNLRRVFYFSSSFLLGCGILFGAFYQLGLFQVRSIPVEVVFGEEAETHAPNLALGPSGLRSRLEKRVRKFSSKKIWEIDLAEIRASVMRDEWVKGVLISRSLPNVIRVQVTPKTPELLLVSDKGNLLPVTDEGSLLSALAPELAPDVPILRGIEFVSSRTKRADAIAFVQHFPQEGPLRRRNIAEISWNKESGYSITLIEPKIEVSFGDDQLSMKVLRVTQVLNYLSANHLKTRVIDASFAKKVLVRLRKGP